jgi:hypothetical protein
MKIVVEPTGALSLAAAISGGLPLKGKRAGIVISGGNVDLESVLPACCPSDSENSVCCGPARIQLIPILQARARHKRACLPSPQRPRT